MRRFFCLFACAVLLSVTAFSCLAEEDSWIVDDDYDFIIDPRLQAQGVMRGMTVEEKVYQLFIVTPENLTGEKQTTQWPEQNPLLQYPVGGVILFGQNIVSEKQLQRFAENLFLDAVHADAFRPFLAVDEEGGSVSRIANKLGYSFAEHPARIGKTGERDQAAAAGSYIASYLAPLGINLDFAPVADVLVAQAPEIGDRSYGKDPQLVAELSLSMAEGLREEGIIPCYKHFPGHGAVGGNTHKGKATVVRTLAQMEKAELIPFARGIESGIEMIMISHFTARELDAAYPCSLSEKVIGGLLREKMGYDGVVITDALRMDAISENYDSDEAAVLALKAGADLLLLPNNFQKAVKGVLEAVETGEISMERLNESVERILALKIRHGLIR